MISPNRGTKPGDGQAAIADVARPPEAALLSEPAWLTGSAALRPLHGVPITIQDAFETTGLRTVSGCPPFARHVPESDAAPVTRLRQAGAVILGKTNLPTVASGIQTNDPVFDRTNNPWGVGLSNWRRHWFTLVNHIDWPENTTSMETGRQSKPG